VCDDEGGLELPAVADCRVLNLASHRWLRTRVAGIFLFVPLLARLGFQQLVTDAGYPGSRTIPPTSALLALLALKLLDKERRSHIDDFNFDKALGLFAGLNILPKKSFATDYSQGTTRDHQLSGSKLCNTARGCNSRPLHLVCHKYMFSKDLRIGGTRVGFPPPPVF
jgi:hypothetical protein